MLDLRAPGGLFLVEPTAAPAPVAMSPLPLPLSRPPDDGTERSVSSPPAKAGAAPSLTSLDSRTSRLRREAAALRNTVEVGTAAEEAAGVAERQTQPEPEPEPELEPEPEPELQALGDGVPLAGVVRIHLLQGRGLKKMDTFGGADPFVVFRIGGAEATSQVAKRTRSPEWDSQHELPVAGVLGVLRCELFDWERAGAPEPMGVVCLPIAEMDSTARWHPLMPADGCVAPEGELRLACGLMLGSGDAVGGSELLQSEAPEDWLPCTGYDDVAMTTQSAPPLPPPSRAVAGGEQAPQPLGLHTYFRISTAPPPPDPSSADGAASDGDARSVSVCMQRGVVKCAAPKPSAAQASLMRELARRARADADTARGVRIRVTIVAGRGLKQMDRWGKADPFVELSLGGTAATRVATQPQLAGLAPGWKGESKTAT